MASFRVSSLRQRILLVVVGGAVLPLALVGWWLTRTAVRSGEAQLRTQLDSSLAVIADGVETRWAMDRGNLLFAAQNEVVRRTLAGGAPTAADSEFMRQIFASVERSAAALRYRSSGGRIVWTFDAVPPQLADSTLPRSVAAADAARSFQTRIPVMGAGADSARLLGELAASVRLSSVLPSEVTQQVVGQSALSVRDAVSGALLLGPPDPGAGWVRIERGLREPGLLLSLAAPAAAYVAPFQRAAKLGLAFLLVVAALVIGLSMFLTTRLTRSLEQLVTATGAVARGDLQRNVTVHGDDETARLAESFNAMTESLRKTLEQLSRQEALAAMGEFAATLSHEVRNALSAVRMDLQRAEESSEGAEKAHALIVRSLANLRRMDGIVSGALRVARQGQGPAQPLDLRVVVERAMNAAEPAFVAADAVLQRLAAPAEDGALPMHGDPTALEQLFLNLLMNAAQALSPGGRTTVGLATNGTGHVVSIRDDGVGMTAAELARAGELLYSSKRGGTGLGLTIARRIVHAHGGTLDMESTPGVGTTVRVSLPRSAAARSVENIDDEAPKLTE
jgi:signal transduction histidine kinase